MINIFRIKSQQEKLKRKRDTLIKRARHYDVMPIRGYKKAKEELNDGCALFNARTKTPLGKIKSFIPGTAEFNYRITAAVRIEAFDKKLNALENAIEHATPKCSNPRYVNGSKAIKKSFSCTDGDIVYSSPINHPPRRKRSLSCVQFQAEPSLNILNKP